MPPMREAFPPHITHSGPPSLVITTDEGLPSSHPSETVGSLEARELMCPVLSSPHRAHPMGLPIMTEWSTSILPTAPGSCTVHFYLLSIAFI